MPYRLKLAKYWESGEESSSSGSILSSAEVAHFIRIAAVNAEMGEGPHSNIVELKRLPLSKRSSRNRIRMLSFHIRFVIFFAKGFTAPDDLEARHVHVTHSLLKWTLSMRNLRAILASEALSRDQQPPQQLHQQKQQKQQQLALMDKSELLRNVCFELYIKERVLNASAGNESKRQRVRHVRPFRTIASLHHKFDEKITPVVLRKKRAALGLMTRSYYSRMTKKELNTVGLVTAAASVATVAAVDDDRLSFEYNLTNLLPNAVYVFELTARLFAVESQASKPLRLITLRKTSFSSFIAYSCYSKCLLYNLFFCYLINK